MKNRFAVFDPRGRVDAARPPAPRGALDGLRLGILDNTKWNAGRLLRKTAALLGERAPLRRGELLHEGKLLEDLPTRRSSRRSPPTTTSS